MVLIFAYYGDELYEVDRSCDGSDDEYEERKGNAWRPLQHAKERLEVSVYDHQKGQVTLLKAYKKVAYQDFVETPFLPTQAIIRHTELQEKPFNW